jgi:NAD(P)-dependent dehydrogenase (short-subunit alcohol dehydrogenase family)
MPALQNKVAVITGGNSGIGLATAKRFVEEGAYVYITGRRQAELDKAVALIGKNVTAIQGDIAKLEDIDRLYAQVKSEKGGIDVVVANAGVVETFATADVTPEHYDKTFDVNARGTFFTVQKALPLLNPAASVIVIGSVVSTKGMSIYSTYSATKAAIRNFVRTWAAELGPKGIRANVISPGPIETPIIDAQFASKEHADALREQFKSIIPLGRMGEAHEIADAALFLASSQSSFINGVDLPVDGGFVSI